MDALTPEHIAAAGIFLILVLLAVAAYEDAIRIRAARLQFQHSADEVPRRRLQLVDGEGNPLGIYREIPAQTSDAGKAA